MQRWIVFGFLVGAPPGDEPFGWFAVEEELPPAKACKYDVGILLLLWARGTLGT